MMLNFALHNIIPPRDFQGSASSDTAVFAIYLALAVANEIAIPQPIIFMSVFSSAFGVLFIYLAKLFTHERQSTRVQKRHKAKEELKSFQRKAASERQRTATLDKMQNTRLKMEADALQELAIDPRIQTIQKKAMWLTVVGEIMLNRIFYRTGRQRRATATTSQQ